MQDFQSIPGLAARLFGGAAAAADLRRGAQCGGPAAAAEAVKCPRCESTNTKFCYYNNYNLSQPRHFCKSCRRYWTKGGVLRNVPVGGGCRKPKRSSASSAASTSASSSAGDAKSNRRASASASRSSSGSSSPTAAAATATASATSSSSTVTVTTQPTSSTVTNLDPNPSVAEVVLPPAPIFADQGASVFTSLLAPPPQLPVFNFSAQPKTEEVASVFAEHTAAAAGTATIAADMTPFSVRLGGAVMAGVDWAPASLDSGIFELTGGIGDTSPAYWNPATWADVPDPTIYLP